MEAYDHQKIEPTWRELWEKNHVFGSPKLAGKKKKYILDMYPYPSGEGLHVGHPLGYIGSDIVARYYRMNGYDVLHPMGWDAFGLPAENFAIKKGVHPKETTDKATARFKQQLYNIGLSYDWEREINSSKPDYYRWTQWFFLLMYDKKLSYLKKAPVNWCPHCQTVLANEQVIQGKCERCDTPVEQKELQQWFSNITSYAERLLSDLDKIDWPDRTKAGQRNWIGKSTGARITFSLKDSDQTIEVYTTRPDTLGGATYLVLAPEHPLLSGETMSIPNQKEVNEYINQAKMKSDLERSELQKEKSGVFTGLFAVNPLNGKHIPVWTADYVLISYGTGSIMGVPAHDQRDFDFAKKYGLEVIPVIKPSGLWYIGYVAKKWSNDYQEFLTSLENINAEFIKKDDESVLFKFDPKHIDAFIDFSKKNIKTGSWHDVMGDDYVVIFDDGSVHKVERFVEDSDVWGREHDLEPGVREFSGLWDMLMHSDYVETICFADEGSMFNSEQFDGLSSSEGREKVIAWLEEQNIGHKETQYKLRDWLISRQRYWGPPIPIIYCTKCVGDGRHEVVNKNGQEVAVIPVPESDLPVLLPEDVNFKPTGQSPLVDSESFREVTCPQCGASGEGVFRESDTLDTFVDSCWYFFRFADPHNENEFASKEKIESWLPVDIYVGGAEHTVLHLMYARYITKVLFDYGYISFDEPFTALRHQGLILGPDGRKMSKRWGNVINPDEVVENLGADTLRMYEMFMGPFTNVLGWNTDGINGVRRFIERIWKVFHEGEKITDQTTPKTLESLHKTIKKVGADIETFSFNTAISSMMEFMNTLEEKNETISKSDAQSFIKILSVFAPHISEEIWFGLHGWQKTGEALIDRTVQLSDWPPYDAEIAKGSDVTIVVQVNGKVRATLQLERKDNGWDKSDVESLARQEPSVSRYFDGVEVKQVIYVPDKLLNFVI
ncbi:leucine--tRNA ligase [candidate division WWE3 bacterium]|uniref:Leucine--tRNA ligase n=1 Tax=candidate division WWE3 bacterium TaxID=2053526 RepID=A0A955LG44_UNCKA|nr:leucine--tRNA ligase [candidate division WWE3 bacterium]